MRSFFEIFKWFLLSGLFILTIVNPWVVNAQERCPDQLVGLRSTIWKTLEIPVCWEEFDQRFSVQRAWTKDAVESTWQKNSALKFVGWGLCSSSARGIRISVAEDNPHVKGLGNQLDGVRDGMVLNLSFLKFSPSCAESHRLEYCIRVIAVHEFGHALGFSHEQNRSDAPTLCQGERQGTSGDVFITPYDLDSVMNYCNPKWSGDGQLSAMDLQGLKSWYGEPAKPKNRFDGRWQATLTYSDAGCVADNVDVTIRNNSVTGVMTTPDGRKVDARANLDDAGQLQGFEMRLSSKDLIKLNGVLTDGSVRSTDCGCGSYSFKRRP